MKSPDLIVVTPASRPQYLRRIYDTLRVHLGSSVDWQWRIVFDGPTVLWQAPSTELRTGRIRAWVFPDAPRPTIWKHQKYQGNHAGHPLRNFATQLAAAEGHEDSLLCYLDDDTYLHPAYPSLLLKFLEIRGDRVGFVVNQDYVTGQPRLRYCAGRQELVDTGELTFSVAAWRDSGGFPCPANAPAETWYRADQGVFASLKAKFPDRIVFFDEVGSYYNAFTEMGGQSWV